MSAEKPATSDSGPAISEAQVRDYLASHKDFFQRNPDMLDSIAFTHSTGSAVSLVEKQVSVLRERNMEMRKRLNSLTDNARDNDRLYDLTRRLILRLLDAEDREALGRGFLAGMREDFEVEHACFILFGERESPAPDCRVEAPDRARIEIGALLKSKAPVCGTLRGEELNYLFPDAGAIGSAAVAPLVKGGELGVIAVGSDDPNRYNTSTGTLFLGHIAEVIVRRLPHLGYQEQAGIP